LINKLKLKKICLSSIRIRLIEEALAEEYFKQEIRTPIHLSIGQEFVASSICNFLSKNDFAISHHRSHAHFLAKGGSLKKFFAELYGKKSGCSKGNGGSMHLVDLSKNFLGATAIVGNSIPVGAGYAYSLKLNKKKSKVCIFVGDGSTEEGVFYETMNFIALKELPVIIFCENNQYSVFTHISKRRPRNVKINKIVNSLGLKSFFLDSSKPLEYLSKLKKILHENKNQPIFIEVLTYRYNEHTGPKKASSYDYSNLKKLNYWKKNDPVDELTNYLINKKIINNKNLKNFIRKVNKEINNSIKFAKLSRPPNYKKFIKEYGVK
tara:strand:- start:155 stop:1120 length:966 start_codon:yes stop_codon:yes gene_type:complete